jgi:fructose-specific phosphotransferase system IIC component
MEREEGCDNSNFIMGMTITLKGRIPTESIKPRKTVQSFIVGSHYSTQPVKHPGRNTG